MTPVLRSLCVFASILSATSAFAVPFQSKTSSKQATIPLGELGASNTGATALPTPTTQAKYVALGLGFQNYTCANSTTGTGLAYVQTKPSDGALANLYDITKNLDSCNVDYIPAEALSAFEICIAKTRCNPAKDSCAACNQFAINYVRSRGVVPAPQVGLHFFATINGSQTPNFNLYKYGDFLSGKKVGDVKAPSNSSVGSSGYGAIDWLYLANNGNGLTHGLSAVYRLETAGGAAPKNCSAIGQVTYQPYAAEYWFYA